jgi:hypothetical protein
MIGFFVSPEFKKSHQRFRPFRLSPPFGIVDSPSFETHIRIRSRIANAITGAVGGSRFPIPVAVLRSNS